MTDPINAYPRLQYLIDGFAGWLKRQRELGEIGRLDHDAMQRIAADLRIAPDDLDALVRNGPHATDELPQMLAALGIDRAALARSQPLVLRDLARVCALCKDKARCRGDLAAGTAATRFEDYCLNAPTIDGLGDGSPA
jgi:hypothetical protein